jgi:hypothetical protein
MFNKPHSGFALAKHIYYNIDNNRPNHPSPEKFCACGGSGGNVYTSVYNNSGKPVIEFKYHDNLTETCGFYTGVSCADKILYRKWSCCNKIIIGKLDDLYSIPPCCK